MSAALMLLMRGRSSSEKSRSSEPKLFSSCGREVGFSGGMVFYFTMNILQPTSEAESIHMSICASCEGNARAPPFSFLICKQNTCAIKRYQTHRNGAEALHQHLGGDEHLAREVLNAGDVHLGEQLGGVGRHLGHGEVGDVWHNGDADVGRSQLAVGVRGADGRVHVVDELDQNLHVA